jgi:hypothetical protein
MLGLYLLHWIWFYRPTFSARLTKNCCCCDGHVCMFQLENRWTNFDDICYVGYAIHSDSRFVVFDLLQSAIIHKFL